jgi:hypothetical protein
MKVITLLFNIKLKKLGGNCFLSITKINGCCVSCIMNSASLAKLIMGQLAKGFR